MVLPGLYCAARGELGRLRAANRPPPEVATRGEDRCQQDDHWDEWTPSPAFRHVPHLLVGPVEQPWSYAAGSISISTGAPGGSDGCEWPNGPVTVSRTGTARVRCTSSVAKDVGG